MSPRLPAVVGAEWRRLPIETYVEADTNRDVIDRVFGRNKE